MTDFQPGQPDVVVSYISQHKGNQRCRTGDDGKPNQQAEPPVIHDFEIPVEAVDGRPRPQLTRQFRIRRRRYLGLDRLFLGNYFRLAQPDINLRPNQQDADREKERADRTLDKGHQIAAGDQQAAPEVFLERRSKHEAEQNWSGVEIETQQDVAYNAYQQGFADLEHVVVGGVDADADEEHRAGIEVAVRNAQKLHPETDHRHVQNDQQDVADPEARDQPPEDVRVLTDELRAGNDAVNNERAQQQRHDGVAGNAQAHGRDEVALHRGMRRGLGACDTLDCAATETLRRLRYLFLGGVGHKGGDRRSGTRNERTEAADEGAADHRPECQLEICLGRKHVGDSNLGIFHVDFFSIVDAVHELGDAEHPERQRDDFDAIEQLGDAEGEAGLSGLDVRSHDADQEAENRH